MNKKQIEINNAIVLANVGEVVARVIKKISGNDVSNTLNRVKITQEVISNIAYQRIVKNLQSRNTL